MSCNNRTVKRKLLLTLVTLRELLKVGSGYHKQGGICMNVRSLTIDTEQRDAQRNLMHELFAKWPESEGRMLYPVPSPKPEQSSIDAYMHAVVTQTVWTGEYGESRKRLLDFMILQLSDDTQESQS